MKIEIINCRLAQGTGERIDQVLKGGELRSAFIRHAIEAELKHRRETATRLPDQAQSSLPKPG